ncbi:hypothetical protein MASR2M69_18410 [Bacteroidota bacterium]
MYIDRLKSIAPKNVLTEKKSMGINMIYLNDLQTLVWNELNTSKRSGRCSGKYRKGSLDRGHLDIQLENLKTIINSLTVQTQCNRILSLI